ncbi:hypothetical protein LX16_5088 [Stackebrandtia albiflava]|uniref:Apea-like HEPN domain-containing protein n=1 Tax=Stackebrandtia albiflava TaxID=406432 RepID=A0A562UPR6_9ACTN|nr:HEPN domain-containing protein [Stackebrandtia albiflava]TWJ07602.1 hypothetical protein LX16_5088 [Stackebrandtia albiflava]
MAREELTRLTGNGNGECGKDDCPNVYRTASGSFVVQGDVSNAFTTMRDAMLGQVPEEHRDRFKQAVRNDPTLRDRLHALAARPDQESIALLVPNVAHWTKRTTQARNDLAHTGKTSNHSFEELIAVVEVTTAVVILNVLHEIGLPPKRQREIVRDRPRLRHTTGLAREWLVASESGRRGCR